MEEEIYQGGFRCVMCDWNDRMQQNYSRDAWLITLVHALVHAIHAAFALL